MRSLHGRLIAMVGTSVMILFAISGIAVCWLIEASLWTEFDSGLRDRLQSLSQLVEQDHNGLIFEWQEGSGVATPIDIENEVLSVWKDGQVIHRFPNQVAALDQFSDRQQGIVSVQLSSAKPGRAALLTFQPRVEPEDIEDSGRMDIPSAIVTMAFARPTVAIDTVVRRLRTLLAAVGCVGLFATLAATWGAVNLGLRPLDEAATKIASISSESLTERIDDGGGQPRELRPLVRTINQLLTRLQSTLERERAFSADVAHELRTPLAGLRAKLDVSLSRPRSVSEHEQTIRQCLAITLQTATVVESLLATTHAKQRMATATPNDLRQILTEIVANYSRTVTQRNLNMHWDIPEGTIIPGHTETINILFRNLIDNAVAYADTGGTIRIAVQRECESHVLMIAISNPVAVLPVSDNSKVFERFWRADRSRNATGKHSGLGLSLCKRLVESLGGTIEAFYEDQQFMIQLAFITRPKDGLQ